MFLARCITFVGIILSCESDGSIDSFSDSCSLPKSSVQLLQRGAAAHRRVSASITERGGGSAFLHDDADLDSSVLPQSVIAESPSGSYRQTMHNIGKQGMAFAADMFVGGQHLRGVLDTGSYELLVFSASCSSCGGGDSLYNVSKSQTHRSAHLRTQHSFGSGDTWSKLGYEEVKIGPFVADDQYFWEVVDAVLPVIDRNGFSAIVGLGPPSTPRSDSKAQAEHFQKMSKVLTDHPGLPRPDNAKAMLKDSLELVNQSTLLERFGILSFSVCIDRSFSGDGYLIWNDSVPDAQTNLTGMFTTSHVIGEVTWGVRMESLRLYGGATDFDVPIGCANGCGVILDSGTSLITVPTFVAKNALDVLNRLSTDCTDFSKLPYLSFDFGGTTFRLPPSAYIGEVYGELPPRMRKYAKKHNLSASFRSCELLLMTMDVETQYGPLYIMGMPFFREYYTTFDLGSNVWDKKGRSVHMAAADEKCQPAVSSPGGSKLAQRQKLQRVDLSQVRFPKWVEQAAEQGTLEI